MKVVVKHPGKPAEVVSIRRMSEIDKLIGGTPGKCFSAGTEHGDLHGYCDDDGIKKDLPINFSRPTDDAAIYGPIVVATWGYTKEGPDWMPLEGPLLAEALALFGVLGVES